VKHQTRCPARSSGRCSCDPVFLAEVWVTDPAGGGRNVARTFATENEAILRRSQTRMS